MPRALSLGRGGVENRPTWPTDVALGREMMPVDKCAPCPWVISRMARDASARIGRQGPAAQSLQIVFLFFFFFAPASGVIDEGRRRRTRKKEPEILLPHTPWQQWKYLELALFRQRSVADSQWQHVLLSMSSCGPSTPPQRLATLGHAAHHFRCSKQGMGRGWPARGRAVFDAVVVTVYALRR